MAADTSPCSIERKCSNVGRACSADDRACQSRATSNGLEITCEQDSTYVYCPPGGQSRDSGVVWILLVVAMAVAAIGAIISWLVIRRNLNR